MLRGPARITALCVVLLGPGCASVASSSEPAHGGKLADSPSRPAPITSTTAESKPALGEDARYRDLIALAQRTNLDASTPPVAGRGCLLARTADGYALGVQPAPATSTWPQPESERPPTDGTAGRVLTPWGMVGSGDDGPMWVAFTPLSAAAIRAAGLLLMLDGPHVWLSRTDRAVTAPAGISIAQAAIEVVKQGSAGDPTVYIAATAGTPVRTVFELLRGLPDSVPVALAVALPAGSTMPPTQAPKPSASQCADGLPEPDAAASEGELSRAQLTAAVQPLAEGAQRCFASARGPAAAGGRVVVALRIGHGGAVTHACITGKSLGDSVLDTCIAETARSLRFAVPSPGGFVDVHLPLHLTATEQPPPRPTCL